MVKSFILSFILIFVSSLCSSASAGERAKIKQLEESNRQLQERVEGLEKKLGDHIEPEAVPAEGEEKPPDEHEMQIILRESFNDKQEAAPRPYELTIEPEYQGFIPIPHTHAMIRFNAQPRIDLTNDSNYAGNVNMFVTSAIPVTGEIAKGGGYQFNMNGQGSRLTMDVRAPKTSGTPRFYYENDFAGTGNAYFNYRVRHLYGAFYGFVVGQTYTIFEDADAWPDTVDYEGPNAAISSRRPLIRYMALLSENWAVGLSLEKPDPQVDTSNDATATSEFHAPEGGFNVRWAKKEAGHVQFAGIFRDIGVSGNAVGSQDVFGWGLSLSSSLNLFKRDSFQTQFAFGQGIYYFMNDAIENNDAAFDSVGQLVPLTVMAAMGGYTHTWSNKFRSTASFGVINLQNEFSQAWNSFHRTYYASANLVFQLFRKLSFGLEGLYGYKQVKSGATGDVFRVQLSIMYVLFK